MENGELKSDPKKLKSSPSAVGLLILDSHRLAYYPETKFAPSFSELRSTCQRLIRRRQTEWINEQVEADTTGGSKKEVRLALWQKYPPCTLRVVPMAGEEDVAKIIANYKLVRRITIKLQATNNELNWDPLFQKLEESRKQSGAKTVKLEHSAPEGLNKKQAVKEVSSATETGNATAYISGMDQQGNRLDHNPEGFKTRVAVEIPEGATPKRAAPFMKHQLDSLVTRGVLRPPAPAPKSQQDADD